MEESSDANPNDVNDFKRDVTPMPKYYDKWSKFNIDEAIKDVENDGSVGFDTTFNNSGQKITGTSSNKKMYEANEIDDDLTPEEKMQKQKEDFLKGTSGAKPNTKLVIKGGARPSPLSNIESMKNQGNNYFKT